MITKNKNGTDVSRLNATKIASNLHQQEDTVDKAKESLAIRPCFVITVGGCGSEISSRLYRNLDDQDDYKFKKLVYFDTDFTPIDAGCARIEVAKNSKTKWVAILIWKSFRGVVAAIVRAVIWRKRRANQIAQQEAMLAGEMVVSPVEEPNSAQRFMFSGTSNSEVVKLDDFTSLCVYSAFDLDDGEIIYSVEMRDGAQIISQTSFQPDTEFQVGDFLVRYLA